MKAEIVQSFGTCLFRKLKLAYFMKAEIVQSFGTCLLAYFMKAEILQSSMPLCSYVF